VTFANSTTEERPDLRRQPVPGAGEEPSATPGAPAGPPGSSSRDGDGPGDGVPPGDRPVPLGEADTVEDLPAAAPATARRRRRLLIVVVLVVVALVALAVSPLSPFSPFAGDPGDEHARVPVEGRSAPTTVPQATDRKYPEAPVAPAVPVPEVPPTTVAPPPPAPGTEPGAGPAPGTPGAPSAPTPGPIAGAGYQVAYADEFAGGLDGAVWETAPFGGSLPAEVSGGTMTLRTSASNGHAWGHVASTGARNDEGEPSYPFARAWEQGYFEARLRYTDDEWSWPAFWLFSMAKSEAWPGEDCAQLNSEWDIMENGVQNGPGLRPAGDWYFTALHRNTSDNSADDRYCGVEDETRTFSTDFPGVDLSAWHTWGARWTDDQLCTYLDDVEIQCSEPYDSTSQPMHLVFTMQYLSRCDGCPARPPELEMEVDWVRVWQR